MNIGELLADKGSLMPLLSTVLRIDLSLTSDLNTRSQAIDIITRWINERTEARDLGFSWSEQAVPFTSGKFSLDWAENEDVFALAMERPDAQDPEDRSWLLDVVYRCVGQQSILSTRLSLRQPRTATMPRPGTPKFISEIVRTIGAWDISRLTDQPIYIDERDIAGFAEFVVSPLRTLPVIAVSEDQRRLYSQSNLLHVDANHLAGVLAGTAHVVTLSRRASQWITDNYGKQYSAFFGAIRCFNAGFNFEADPRAHRLWLDAEVDRLEAIRRHGFADTIVRHVFAQVTASFEALPLVAPRGLRRQQEREATEREQAKPDVELTSATASWSEYPSSEAVEPASKSVEDRVLLASQRDSIVTDLIGRLQAETLSRAAYEEQQDKELQALRADNAELSKKLADELEMRQEFERENTRLEAQLAIYTGKTSSGEETLASRFLSAFASAFGSARDLIDSQSQLERDGVAFSSEIETLRDQLAEARSERYKLAAQLKGMSGSFQKTSPAKNEDTLKLGDPDSLEAFFSEVSCCIVTNGARKSFGESPYNNAARMEEALRLLRDCYVPMRCCPSKEERDEIYGRFQQALTEGAFTWGPTATTVGKGKAPEDHTQRTRDGRTIDCEKIRDKSMTFNRQDFLCVYFAWDEQEAELYVKGFRHGDTPSAHT